MMNKITLSNFKLVTACFVALSLFSCKKEVENIVNPPEPDPAPVAPTTQGFYWSENGGEYIKADSAYWSTFSPGTGIRAYKDSTFYFFEVVWSKSDDTIVGTKKLKPAEFNFNFSKGNDVHLITAEQNLNLTAFKNGLMSGNFNVNVTGTSSVKTVAATFNELKEK